jgi:hypothetical protein
MKNILVFIFIAFAINIYAQQPVIKIVSVENKNSCSGQSTGAITITSVTGESSPYVYSDNLQDSTFQSSNKFTNLSPKIYGLRVKDHFNRISSIYWDTLSESKTRLVDSCSGTNLQCGDSGGTITVMASGGAEPYQYSWSNNSQNATQTGIQPGTYTATVIDANECKATCAVTISQSGSSKPKYNIGDTLTCGYIFYVDPRADSSHPCYTHYLVCAFNDQDSRIAWYNNSYSITNATTDILFDKRNADLIDSVSDAANACSKYTTQDSCTGWYLPSKAELDTMYANLAAKGIGKFATEGYWSSVEAPKKHCAWIVDFYNGNDLQNDKSNKYHIRAVCEVWLRNE